MKAGKFRAQVDGSDNYREILTAPLVEMNLMNPKTEP